MTLSHHEHEESDELLERRLNEARLIKAVDKLTEIVDKLREDSQTHGIVIFGNATLGVKGLVPMVQELHAQAKLAEMQRAKLLEYLALGKRIVKIFGPIVLLLLGSNNEWIQAIVKAVFDLFTG